MAGKGGARAARKHSGPSTGSSAASSLALIAGGAVVTGLAWIFLVSAAIDFGSAAVHGQSLAWVFTFGAALGGVVAMVLLLALVGRGMRVLGLLSEYRPRRVAPRRRR